MDEAPEGHHPDGVYDTTRMRSHVVHDCRPGRGHCVRPDGGWAEVAERRCLEMQMYLIHNVSPIMSLSSMQMGLQNPYKKLKALCMLNDFGIMGKINLNVVCLYFYNTI